MQDHLRVSMKGEFASLFDEVETWARKYTNVPDQEIDSSLPSRLINRIKSNSKFRPCPKYFPEIEHHAPNVPIILDGTKLVVREESSAG